MMVAPIMHPPYRSFLHESRALHAVRLVHFITSGEGDPLNRIRLEDHQSRYWYSLDQDWNYLKHYCIYKAEIEHVCYLNAPDVGRFGGKSPPWLVGRYCRSRRHPIVVVLTNTSDTATDDLIRSRLSQADPANDRMHKIEALSWFGYAPLARTVPPPAVAPFRLIGKPYPELFSQTCLVMLEHISARDLTSVSEVFSAVDAPILSLDQQTWTPLIVGLLKGNVDAFVLLGKINPYRDAQRYEEAQALATFLFERSTEHAFWSSVSPIAAYFCTTKDVETSVVVPNLELLFPVETERKGCK